MLFFQVIESREMMDESKDRDTIDGAVRVAHLVKHASFLFRISHSFKKSFVLLTPRVIKILAQSPPTCTCKAFTDKRSPFLSSNFIEFLTVFINIVHALTCLLKL